MNFRMQRNTLTLCTAAIVMTHGAVAAAVTVPVTADNYVRAESDEYFAAVVKRGGFGHFAHRRAMVELDKQNVVRPNRDTLYSTAIFDLQAGPVTVTLPKAEGRYLSLQAIDEDHYTRAMMYAPGPHTFTREQVGTRYVLVAVRILANPDDPADMEAARALQDQIQVSAKGTGRFDIPEWDKAGLTKIRQVLQVMNTTLSDTRRMFGTPEQVDPMRHMIGTAAAWGGIPEKDTFYLPITPARNDGQTVSRMIVGQVPVDGFWSVSVYNARGFFEPNRLNAYSLNNLTARRNADGTVTVQFGGCSDAVPNCLPTMPGWNYLVRLYRAHPDVLSGAWAFPQAQPVN